MRDDNTALAVRLLLCCIVCCTVLFPVAAAAQDAPHLVVGWVTTRPDFSTGPIITERLNGWNAELVLPAYKGLGIVGDVEGMWGKRIPLGFVTQPNGSARPTITAAGTGVRYTWRRDEAFTPFAEGRIGVAAFKMATSRAEVVSMATGTNFEESTRAGADFRIGRLLGVEATAGYRAAHVFDHWEHRVEFGVGGVWWFK